MANVVNAPPAVFIVRLLRIGAALIDGLSAKELSDLCGPVGLLAERESVKASTVHESGKLHIVINGVVDGLDTICVVVGKFGVVRGLDGLIDDSIANTKSIKYKRGAFTRSIGNKLILFIKIIVK